MTTNQYTNSKGENDMKPAKQILNPTSNPTRDLKEAILAGGPGFTSECQEDYKYCKSDLVESIRTEMLNHILAMEEAELEIQALKLIIKSHRDEIEQISSDWEW